VARNSCSRKGGIELTPDEVKSLIGKLDSADMIGFTRSFVDDFESALKSDIGLDGDDDWSGVLCIGMGGSGAGGRFLSALADSEGGLPFVTWNDYGLPSWWGPDWLVMATSYSGETEETLDGATKAIENGGTVIGISSGGRLSDILGGNDDSVCIDIPGGQTPRSAFGHIFGTQLSVCWRLGLLPSFPEGEIESMIKRLRSASSSYDLIGGDGMPINLASTISGKGLGIVSPGEMGPAAYRFSCQLNENSNSFARPAEVPEMNHNEIVPWMSANADSQALVLLTCDGINPRTKSRIDWMMENVEGPVVWRIDCEGESLLERLLYAAHVSDWISIALALINGVDPSEMDAISGLKAHLSVIQ